MAGGSSLQERQGASKTRPDRCSDADLSHWFPEQATGGFTNKLMSIDHVGPFDLMF
jgi:hypothetical protein